MKNRPGNVLAAILLSMCATGVWSQATPYPSKVVRIVNPVAPGGNQDTIARTIAEQLTRSLGQPFVIESRPASSAIVGTRYVKSAPPDGYTLLAISNTFVRVPALMADPGYDPVKDFAAISITGEVPLVFVVNPALPVKTVQEFIALAKRRPGELSNASSGVGSTGHVAAEVFSRRAGIKLLNVQYKGAAPAVIDLVGGHVMLRFDQVTTSLPFIRAGKLRPLGVSTLKRCPALPDVPTIDESGLPGFYDPTFNGLMAPAGTPREIIERLRDGVAKGVAVPEVHNRLLDQGIDLVSSSSVEEFAAYIRKHAEEFAVLARQTGMAVR
ncbi:MAG: tripartite tricarboxylate transporter substrate binding protein [Burkholderiales bacterium]